MYSTCLCRFTWSYFLKQFSAGGWLLWIVKRKCKTSNRSEMQPRHRNTNRPSPRTAGVDTRWLLLGVWPSERKDGRETVRYAFESDRAMQSRWLLGRLPVPVPGRGGESGPCTHTAQGTAKPLEAQDAQASAAKLHKVGVGISIALLTEPEERSVPAAVWAPRGSPCSSLLWLRRGWIAAKRAVGRTNAHRPAVKCCRSVTGAVLRHGCISRVGVQWTPVFAYPLGKRSGCFGHTLSWWSCFTQMARWPGLLGDQQPAATCSPGFLLEDDVPESRAEDPAQARREARTQGDPDHSPVIAAALGSSEYWYIDLNFSFVVCFFCLFVWWTLATSPWVGHSAQERISRLNPGVCTHTACRIGLFCRLHTFCSQDQDTGVAQSCQKDHELVGIVST